MQKITGLSSETLKWMEKNRKIPPNQVILNAASALGVDPVDLKLSMGMVDSSVLDRLHGRKIPEVNQIRKKLKPAFTTSCGRLYEADCLEVYRSLESESVDLVFADPPFNLGKLYPSKMNDSLKEEEYLEWCHLWLDESVRILKPGGSLFVYNLPKWSMEYGRFLSERLTFRHAIAIDIKFSLPIGGRLYPSHYSLLYFVKGDKPRVFHPDRLPTETCPKCYGDLRDYGGYKDKMNPLGVNLTDVWTDIPPVRHARHKKREGANELSIKLLDRVIEMATDEKDVVFDPFGGSGTTYFVAEVKNRQWIGAEIGPKDGIVERLESPQGEDKVLKDHRKKLNALHPESVKIERKKRGIWTADTFSKPQKTKAETDLFGLSSDVP